MAGRAGCGRRRGPLGLSHGLPSAILRKQTTKWGRAPSPADARPPSIKYWEPEKRNDDVDNISISDQPGRAWLIKSACPSQDDSYSAFREDQWCMHGTYRLQTAVNIGGDSGLQGWNANEEGSCATPFFAAHFLFRDMSSLSDVRNAAWFGAVKGADQQPKKQRSKACAIGLRHGCSCLPSRPGGLQLQGLHLP